MHYIASMATVVTLLGSAAAIDTAAAGPPSASEFEEIGIIVEQNATDGDTEVVISGVAGDDGLRMLKVVSPDKRKILTLIAPDPATLGQREFHFESPEPPGEAVLAGYPEGTYVFLGVSTTGEHFRGTAELSHELPGETTILYPVSDSVIPATALTIQWSAVPGIREYILEFENESLDPEQALTVNLPAGTTSFEVPTVLLIPGSEYQVGIQTVGENGNIVAIESTFSTAE